MNFCQVLHKAQKNDKNSTSGARYYSTKFEPPKKIKKESKDLSENIKKFLANKEAEEQKKLKVDKKKKDELLALRAQDKKATRRVNVMLKRTKSANQSVIEDAVDNTHTAVTRAGPEQPDEDDYGYVSQEATALYEKMMEKYSQIPEEPKFNLSKKKVNSTNLNSTKDRVKAALEKEREEAMQPHRRKRKRKHEEGKEGEEKDDDVGSSPDRKETQEKDVPKPKPKPRPAAPPPMSFTEILKIAAQKQHEPVVIEEKPQEEEKLYTKKQRRELEKEREWKERRERRHNEMESRDRDNEGKDKAKSSSSSSSSSSNNKVVPKTTSSTYESKILERQLTKPIPSSGEKSQAKDRDRPSNDRPSNKDKDRIPSKQVKFSSSGQKPTTDVFKKPSPVDSKPSKLSSSANSALKHDDARHKNEGHKQLKHNLPSSSSKSMLPNGAHGKSLPNKNSELRMPSKGNPSSGASRDGPRKGDLAPKKGPPAQMASAKFSGRPKEFPPRDLLPKGKPKEFPPRDLKPKQFPPPDVRGIKRKPPIVASRGRIIDDDDEDEYDSELDDFIDDGPEEGDYSSYIKEIFGYDKSRYRDVDDDVDNMETTFAQQMKEEVISAKIGIREDLEDMKKEEEDKRRKAMMKKKARR